MAAPGTLLALVLRSAPPADADAVLLDRFVRYQDGPAFEGLVRRYAALVAGVCRRRLGDGPDADDAFQATFLVLARDAGKVANPAALPGWLYRVAYLVAGKAIARRRPTALADDPADRTHTPEDTAAGRELRMLLDAELAALPEKQRAVAVLCLVEGRSAPDVAAVLGVPVGTVESRLHHARKALQARLTRRGVTAAAVAALLAGGTGSSAAGLDRLISLVTAAVAAGGAVPESISDLVHGVTTMIPTKSKLLAAGLISLGLFGTAAGVLQTAGDKPKPDAPPAKPAAKAEPAKPKEPAAVPADVPIPSNGVPVPSNGVAFALKAEFVRVQLREDAKLPEGPMTLGELLETLSKQHGISFRFDVAEFARMGMVLDPTHTKTKNTVEVQNPRGTTVEHVLTDALAQVKTTSVNHAEGDPTNLGFRVRGKQVVISPKFQLHKAGDGDDEPLMLSAKQIAEMKSGPPVSISVTKKKFADVIEELREQTGANIVLDARCAKMAEMEVSGTLEDVRLITALTVFGGMCDLEAKWVGNVFVITAGGGA